MANAIQSAPTIREPFTHGFVDRVFPEETYRALLQHFDQVDEWDDLAHPDAGILSLSLSLSLTPPPLSV